MMTRPAARAAPPRGPGGFAPGPTAAARPARALALVALARGAPAAAGQTANLLRVLRVSLCRMVRDARIQGPALQSLLAASPLSPSAAPICMTPRRRQAAWSYSARPVLAGPAASRGSMPSSARASATVRSCLSGGPRQRRETLADA